MRLLTIALGVAAQEIWIRPTAENQLGAVTSERGNRLPHENSLAAVEPAVCGEGEVHCTAEMVQKGANCIVGLCTKQRCLHPWETGCQQDSTQPAVCAADEVICNDELVRRGMNCIIGACVKAPPPPPSTTTPRVGGQDEHGCILGAGFSWCEGKQKCLRVWEEPCEATTGSAPLGGAQDEHGCVRGAGYSWCEGKQKCLRPWEELCEADGAATRFGGARDEHGCVLGGGYSWCEPKQKCLRRWEEKCEESDPEPRRPILQTIRERFGQFPRLAEVLGSRLPADSDERVQNALKVVEDKRAALLAKIEDFKQKREAWAQEHGVDLSGTNGPFFRPGGLLSDDRTAPRSPLGAVRDANGCVTGAGYSWCEPKAKCLRAWEEACEAEKAAPAVGTEAA